MSKKKTPRNDKYLAYIRAQDCCSCGRTAPSQAAHVRNGNGGGMGLKPSDYRTVPLCAACHGRQHGMGEKSFWTRAGHDPDILISGYIMGFVEDRKLALACLEAIIDGQLKEIK